MRHKFKVSVKAAVFNEAGDKVAVMHTSRHRYGLPGGHIESSEGTTEAMRRELLEECGLTKVDLEKTSFFMNHDDRVILFFTGYTTETTLRSTQNNLEGIPVWVSKPELKNLNINPMYKKLALSAWPRQAMETQ